MIGTPLMYPMIHYSDLQSQNPARHCTLFEQLPCPSGGDGLGELTLGCTTWTLWLPPLYANGPSTGHLKTVSEPLPSSDRSSQLLHTHTHRQLIELAALRLMWLIRLLNSYTTTLVWIRAVNEESCPFESVSLAGQSKSLLSALLAEGRCFLLAAEFSVF